MSTKLFVGNLSFNTTENEIQEAFAAHGTVVEANLMMDRMSGRSRGFAFVTMSTPEEAQKAIEAMNGATTRRSRIDGQHRTPERRTSRAVIAVRVVNTAVAAVAVVAVAVAVVTVINFLNQLQRAAF